MEKRRASRDPDELRAELASIDFSGDVAHLSELRSEARETVDAQVTTLDDVDTKASKILRLNVLLIGVIVSAVSIAARTGDAGTTTGVGSFTNVYVKLGVASLVLSTALAAVTYTVSELDVGVSSGNLLNLLRADLSPDEAQELLVKNYVVRINFNRSTNVRNIPLITSTILLLVTSVVCLSLGMYQAAIGNVPAWLAVASAGLLGAIVRVSGLVTQTRRAVLDLLRWRDEELLS